MELYGRKWTRRELEARVGRIEQIGGVRRFRLVEGLEDGVELIEVRTGAGLRYNVLPSRALDISLAEYGGAALSWGSAGGDVHPAYYDAQGAEWLRTAAGGLLMTCGLAYVGAPGADQGQAFGLHGRIHHLPARHVSAAGRWVGDEYEMQISGVVDEAIMFGEHLRLSRQISSRLGTNRIEIHDRVENLGFEPAPLMVLYHFNFGFPLLNEDTEFRFPSSRVTPRDAGTPIEGYDRWTPPKADYRERVYYHQGLSGDHVQAVIRNPRFPLTDGAGHIALEVVLEWSTVQLPKLVQWKMPGAGLHVLGVEPANCYVEGRAAERERGTLVIMEPGEEQQFDLALELRTGG